MVLLQPCPSYDKELVLERVREIFEKHGGIERFASPGRNVVIKPNLVAKKKPEAAATTHPALVWAVAKLCVEQGATVTVAESSGGLYEPALLKSLYQGCGIAQAAEEAGAMLNYDTSVSHVENDDDAMYLKHLDLITPVVKADTVISLSKLKTHGMMVYTGAVKNTFGCIAGMEKAEYHFKMSDYDEFANCIIDIHLASRVSLNIIDAVVGMERDGPTAGDPRQVGLLISSPNAFHADLAAVGVIDLDPLRVPVLKNAISRGLCPASYSELELVGAAVASVAVPDFIVKHNDDLRNLHFAGPFSGVLSRLVRPRPVFHKDQCKSCGECAKCCPAHVITVEKGKCAQVDLSKCIRCYCCQELCPFHAVTIKKPLINRLFISR